MPTYSQTSLLGSSAKDFNLPGTNGKKYSLTQFANAKALVVVFMCNHCPYVKATLGRINRLAGEYKAKGVEFIGINSNDAIRYPDDSFDEMKKLAQEQKLVFPYLYDESQAVARAYDAACTPEFFAYSNVAGSFTLQYHGRFDDNWKDESAVTQRDLAGALDTILAGQKPNPDQKPAIGCSIKWKG